jgi:HNH endonuclease
MSEKYNQKFMDRLRECAVLDEETGVVAFTDMYAVSHLNMSWGGTTVATPYSHVVWFLKHGRWPRKGYHIDHINDNPFDNRPENLQEITEQENHKKRRGRIIYRNYGTGKYGYGMYIHHDKRDDRYYVTRHLSRGHGEGDLKAIRQGLGGFDTLEEAEGKVAEYIEDIKVQGLAWMPPPPKDLKVKKRTVEIDAKTDELRRLRREGLTIDEIKEITGLKSGVYSRVKDIGIDGRSRLKGEGNSRSKLNEIQVLEIRKLKAEGKTLDQLSVQFGMSKTMIANIVNRKSWTHI